MRSGRDFQRTPTTTQSAVFSGFTFTTPSREPGRYARSRRFAITPSRPMASKRSSQPSASSRSRDSGRELEALRAALEARAPLRQRLAPGLDALPDEDVERDEARGNLGRQLVDAALGRMEPHLHRVEVEDAVALDDDLAVESGEWRKQLLERAQLGEVAQERPRVARPEAKLAGSVLEEAAEAVPLRLVLPLAARRGARARAPPPSAGTGSTSCRSAGRSTGSRGPMRDRAIGASYYAPVTVRRVVVTGLGAVTPLGLDAQSTWDAAVAGRSGVDWIRAFDASDFPVRIASEVKGFEAEAIVGAKDARRLERNVVLAVAAAREAWADAGVADVAPARAGVLVGSAIGGVIGVMEQNDVLRERGHTRVSPWFLPERARRLGKWPDRHRSRCSRSELRARVGVCHGLACSWRGGGDDSPWRRRRHPRRRHRVLHAPRHPRRLLRDARARRRG